MYRLKIIYVYNKYIIIIIINFLIKVKCLIINLIIKNLYKKFYLFLFLFFITDL